MPFDMGHPYIRRHVEGHLVFGPLSRGDPVRPVVASIIVAGFVAGYGFWEGEGFLVYAREAWGPFAGMLAATAFLKGGSYERAAPFWLGFKASMGCLALFFAGLMAPILFLQGKDDAWAALFLGLVWLPGVEFIPWVLPRQKYVTAARILLFYLWLLRYAVNSPG